MAAFINEKKPILFSGNIYPNVMFPFYFSFIPIKNSLYDLQLVDVLQPVYLL